jgi:hypothetical protein
VVGFFNWDEQDKLQNINNVLILAPIIWYARKASQLVDAIFYAK